MRFDGQRVGYLPKRLTKYLASAMDTDAVSVSLKMDGGAWQVNSSTLDELRKLRQDPKRRVPYSCNIHLTVKMNANAETASQLAVAQLHEGIDAMSE